MSNDTQRPLGLSIAITVRDEVKELSTLLANLIPYDYGHVPVEIVIQQDTSYDKSEDVKLNVTKLIDSLKDATLSEIEVRWTEFSFSGNFSEMKNNLRNSCTFSWILQLDADEYPSINLLANALQVVVYSETEPDLYAIAIPRANRVRGLTKEDVKKWRWSIKATEELISLPPLRAEDPLAIDEAALAIENEGQALTIKDYSLVTTSLLVNWPDYQVRLYRNDPSVTWVNKVHEILNIPRSGKRAMMNASICAGVYIMHTKFIEKQRIQNSLYDNLTYEPTSTEI